MEERPARWPLGTKDVQTKGLAVGRLLQNNLVRADARDLVTFIVTVAVLVTVALVASIVPARRATRIEPTTALRVE